MIDPDDPLHTERDEQRTLRDVGPEPTPCLTMPPDPVVDALRERLARSRVCRSCGAAVGVACMDWDGGARAPHLERFPAHTEAAVAGLRRDRFRAWRERSEQGGMREAA